MTALVFRLGPHYFSSGDTSLANPTSCHLLFLPSLLRIVRVIVSLLLLHPFIVSSLPEIFASFLRALRISPGCSEQHLIALRNVTGEPNYGPCIDTGDYIPSVDLKLQKLLYASKIFPC